MKSTTGFIFHFWPKTNILWVHFSLTKVFLLTNCHWRHGSGFDDDFCKWQVSRRSASHCIHTKFIINISPMVCNCLLSSVSILQITKIRMVLSSRISKSSIRFSIISRIKKRTVFCSRNGFDCYKNGNCHINEMTANRFGRRLWSRMTTESYK